MRRTDPNCAACGGVGFRYVKPRRLRGMVTSMRSQRQLVESGYASPGDMILSPQFLGPTCGVDAGVSPSDKITATWPQAIDEGQVLVRGAALIGDNAMLAHGLGATEDRLWYEPADAIWCEDERGVVYTQGADFVFAGRTIRWVGNAPVARTRYVLKYRGFMEWIAWVPPQERLDRDGINLGQVVFLRRRTVAFVNESPRVVDADRIALSDRMAC